MTTATDYDNLTERQLLRRIARNAAKLDAAAGLFDERIALFKAARRPAGPRRARAVAYAVIADAASMSEAGVFKALRDDRKRNGKQ